MTATAVTTADPSMQTSTDPSAPTSSDRAPGSGSATVSVAGDGTASPRWLSNLEMRGWRAFAEINNHLMAALEADLSPHGLTFGDYEVLVNLSEAPDRQLRMCDLAERLGLSPSGLTRRLDGLVRGGYVARQPPPKIDA
jgi:hypothetical protein